MTPRHLYLHVPFCVRRCSYCDFAVTVAPSPPERAWVESVARELEVIVEAQGWPVPWQLDTIYCGGGTPSLLGGPAMARLRERLSPLVTWDASAEWTCEANPESFTADVARDWRSAGVNRLSLGAQSFDPAVLRWMGRQHGPEGPRQAVVAARQAGFENISVDVIFGLPTRLGREWSADLAGALSLEPQHVSLYGLTAEPATPLGRWVEAGRERLADETSYAAEYLEAMGTLEKAGFEAYEVSNFARSGRESRHNRAYWDGRAYLGLGSGAHSFLPPRRWWNVRDWHEYSARITAGGAVVAGEEMVSASEARLERVWLALRQRTGLPAAELGSDQLRLVEGWRAAGWAAVDPERVRLTAEGWLRLDALAVALASAAEDLGAGAGASLDSVIGAA